MKKLLQTPLALLFFTLPCIFFSLSIRAQHPSQIEEVIIDAARIPRAIDKLPFAAGVISGTEVQRAQAQLGLDESLTTIPGIFLQNRYNYAQDLRISIRGFGARANFGIRGVKIFVDDIPETLADGQGGIDSLDLGSIGKVEVIRGPSSSLYGNASGGVINIYSEFDQPDNTLEARFAAGGDGYKKNQLKAAGTKGKLSYLTSFSDQEVDGYRDHSESRNRLLNSRFRYLFADESQLNVAINYTKQPVANDPGGITQADVEKDRRAARDRNVQLNAGEKLDQTRIGFSYKRKVSDSGEITVRNYYTWRDFDGLIPLGGNGAIEIDRYFAGGGLMYKHEGTIDNKNSTTIFGVDYDRQDDDRRRFQNIDGKRGDLVLDQRELVTSLGLYLQNQTTVTENWRITIGLRYDNIKFEVSDHFSENSGKRSLEQASPMIGSSYTISPELNLYANISSAFESPTTTELAVSGTTGLNDDLQPQKATNFELGIKGLIKQRHRYSIAFFHINVRDEIIQFENSIGDDLFTNAGKSERDGIEFSINSPITETLTASLAYTWSDFEFDKFVDKNGNNFSGNELPGQPKNLLQMQLNYQSRNGFFATIESLYVDEFALNNANSAHTESYLLSNLRAGYTYSTDIVDIEPFFGISNVFNKAYTANARANAFGGRYFEPGPDRNAYGGVLFRYRLDHTPK